LLDLAVGILLYQEVDLAAHIPQELTLVSLTLFQGSQAAHDFGVFSAEPLFIHAGLPLHQQQHLFLYSTFLPARRDHARVVLALPLVTECPGSRPAEFAPVKENPDAESEPPITKKPNDKIESRVKERDGRPPDIGLGHIDV